MELYLHSPNSSSWRGTSIRTRITGQERNFDVNNVLGAKKTNNSKLDSPKLGDWRYVTKLHI
jgi:hypothetical protein